MCYFLSGYFLYGHFLHDFLCVSAAVWLLPVTVCFLCYFLSVATFFLWLLPVSVCFLCYFLSMATSRLYLLLVRGYFLCLRAVCPAAGGDRLAVAAGHGLPERRV